MNSCNAFESETKHSNQRQKSLEEFTLFSLLNSNQETCRYNSSTSNLSDVCESMKSNFPSNISANELEKIHESLTVVQGGGKKKRTVYAEKDKQEIAKYAAVCGATAAIRKFQQRFPLLTESPVRPWVKSYKKSIQDQVVLGGSKITIS